MATTYRTEVRGDAKKLQAKIKAGEGYYPWRLWSLLADREDRDQFRQDSADAEDYFGRRESFFASPLPVRFSSLMESKPAEPVEDPEPRDLPRMEGLTLIGWWPPAMLPPRRRDDPDPDEVEAPEMMDVYPGMIVRCVVERRPSVNQTAPILAHLVAEGRLRLHTESEWAERGRFLGAVRNVNYRHIVARMAVYEEVGLSPIAAERVLLEDSTMRAEEVERQMKKAEVGWHEAVATRRKKR